jgi:hypothetical protein
MRRLIPHERKEAHAVHRETRQTQRIQDRRHDVDEARDILDPPRAEPREEDDQGHADGALIEKDSVSVLAVITERLAVISDHDDQRAIQKAPPVEGDQDARDLRIDECDRTQVRHALVHRAVWLGRRVRSVRIVEMDPREKA